MTATTIRECQCGRFHVGHCWDHPTDRDPKPVPRDQPLLGDVAKMQTKEKL